MKTGLVPGQCISFYRLQTGMYPTDIYLLKVAVDTPEQCVKTVQA